MRFNTNSIIAEGISKYGYLNLTVKPTGSAVAIVSRKGWWLDLATPEYYQKITREQFKKMQEKINERLLDAIRYKTGRHLFLMNMAESIRG